MSQEKASFISKESQLVTSDFHFERLRGELYDNLNFNRTAIQGHVSWLGFILNRFAIGGSVGMGLTNNEYGDRLLNFSIGPKINYYWEMGKNDSFYLGGQFDFDIYRDYDSRGSDRGTTSSIYLGYLYHINHFVVLVEAGPSYEFVLDNLSKNSNKFTILEFRIGLGAALFQDQNKPLINKTQ